MVKYLVISDIHLGHKINKTIYIVSNLHNFFRDYRAELKGLDMIVIAGDIFDKLLITSSEDYILATEWLSELILYCKNNNIILRILEGTPSHDFGQAKVITTIIEKLKIELDYKYISTLTIEIIKELGITVLYIPDEYKAKASDTYKEVLELLQANKLDQVDIAIMHGQFHYQLPMARLDSSHTESDYLAIVKHYISIGHIHTRSVYDRIIAQGSFDRLAHGEEELKGGVLIKINGIGGDMFTFLDNKQAMKFNTYRFDSSKSLEDIISFLDQEVLNLPTGSNLRLISEDNEFLFKNADDFRKRYATMNIKIDKPKVSEKKYTLINQEFTINSFNITKSNIEELLNQELIKYQLNQEELSIVELELKKII